MWSLWPCSPRMREDMGTRTEWVRGCLTLLYSVPLWSAPIRCTPAQCSGLATSVHAVQCGSETTRRLNNVNERRLTQCRGSIVHATSTTPARSTDPSSCTAPPPHPPPPDPRTPTVTKAACFWRLQATISAGEMAMPRKRPNTMPPGRRRGGGEGRHTGSRSGDGQ